MSVFRSQLQIVVINIIINAMQLHCQLQLNYTTSYKAATQGTHHIIQATMR